MKVPDVAVAQTTIAKRYAFSASHQLDGLPEDHPCSRLHGHNYEVEFVLRGPLDARGFVVDYRELDAFIKPFIDANLDHRHVNDAVKPSTSEHLALWLFQAAVFEFNQLVAVRVSETPKTWAEYRP